MKLSISIVKMRTVRSNNKYYDLVQVTNEPLKMRIFSGARYSLIPEDIYIKMNLGIPLENTKIAFRSYSGDITPAKDEISVTISYKNRKIHDYLYIVPPGHDVLLGRKWIRRLHIELQQVDRDRFDNFQCSTTSSVNSLQNMDNLLSKNCMHVKIKLEHTIRNCRKYHSDSGQLHWPLESLQLKCT
ncbi:hypothetical protein HHI36_007679 [Cryptolaemus montrouzieri]|uniref:Uncharacterized protein n=1 Tax=Cryptolaemus montrouzieri TaxID=559131 RepID=A0ABD2MR34_9CUCU